MAASVPAMTCAAVRVPEACVAMKISKGPVVFSVAKSVMLTIGALEVPASAALNVIEGVTAAPMVAVAVLSAVSLS
jgi:hypothetical protein